MKEHNCFQQLTWKLIIEYFHAAETHYIEQNWQNKTKTKNTFIMLQKISFSYKYCSFYSLNNPEK